MHNWVYIQVSENYLNIHFLFLLQIEIDSADELTEEFLIDEIHPKQNIYKPKFSKPKGPLNRGARRLVKVNVDPE